MHGALGDEDMTTACSPGDTNRVVGPWLHPAGPRGCMTCTRATLPCSWYYFQPAPLCCGEGLTLGVSACQTWPPELQADCQPADAGWGLWAGTRGLMEQVSKEGTVSCSVDGASCGPQASPPHREGAAPGPARTSPRTRRETWQHFQGPCKGSSCCERSPAQPSRCGLWHDRCCPWGRHPPGGCFPSCPTVLVRA